MASMTLRPITVDDAEFVCSVRNHPETLRWLHDQTPYSAEHTRDWIGDLRLTWYIVEVGGQPVGYFRQVVDNGLKIGCDIHPRHRRRGYGEAAFREYFRCLANWAWSPTQRNRIWLEVLRDNMPARHLYGKLGFQYEGCKRACVWRNGVAIDSLVMSLIHEPKTGKNAKVIVTYLGPRRSEPRTPRDVCEMLDYLVEQEARVDPGCPMDTIVVVNRSDRSDEWTHRGLALLGREVKFSARSGRFFAMHRSNVGYSFGGYNDAFMVHRNEYDYWLFTEDDHIFIRYGYMQAAIDQLEADRDIGFVAMVGVDKPHGRQKRSPYPPHAHGGVGVVPARVLNEIVASRGALPHQRIHGYDFEGEIAFTNAIHEAGYKLVDCELGDVCTNWKRKNRRTRLVRPWRE